MNIGTWNIQGIAGKIELIAKEAKNLNMEIIALTETKKKGSGTDIIGDYIHIYSGVPKDHRAKRGVSLLINKKWKNKITNWEPINENILKISLNVFQTDIIIAVYALSDDQPVTKKDKFFAELDVVISDIESSREVILLGDFNGRTGRHKNSKVVGPFGEEAVNDNGQRLIDIMN